jgi:hypothetical protein
MVKRSIKDARLSYREEHEDFKRHDWVMIGEYPA